MQTTEGTKAMTHGVFGRGVSARLKEIFYDIGMAFARGVN